MFHDTHAHLDLFLQKYLDLPEQRSIQLNAEWRLPFELQDVAREITPFLSQHQWVIQPTVSTANAILNSLLWQSFDNIYLLIGSHPEIVERDFDVETYILDQKKAISRLQNQPAWSKVIGIGECGLDYYYSQDPVIVQKQKNLFRSQIELALELKLPLVIHSREAFSDTFAMLDEYPEIRGKFEIHCFTGTQADMQHVVQRGGKMGIGGIVTFQNALALQEAVEQMPLESILIETDLPFLAPVPHRGQICLPEFVQVIVEKIAQLKQTSPEHLWACGEKNSKDLFGFSRG